MKISSFLIGTLFGITIATPLIAASYLVPAWSKESVRPFIIVKEHDIMRGVFIPTNSTSVVPPQWKKEELTAIIMVKEHDLRRDTFIPIATESVMPPMWHKSEIAPVIQVKESPTSSNFIPVQ